MELTGDLHLKWPWVPLVLAAGVLLLCVWWSRPRRQPADGALLVAHTARLRALPRYRVLLRRHRRAGALLTIASIVVLAGAALVLARPQVVETEAVESRGRDIMICLDASKSMDDDNIAVVRELRRIVDGLSGDRVGLVIWSGAPVMVFPLTDDYDYARSELDRAEDAFSGGAGGFFAGIDTVPNRASLIGDGIVSCVDRFDQPASERTRAVIVTSDNDPLGQPLYTLPEAGRYAAARDVLLYGIGAPALADPQRSDAREELAQALDATGGELALVRQDGVTDRILDRINELEEARAAEPPRRVSRDAPELGVVVSGSGLALLGLTWGLELASRTRRGARR